MSNNKHVSVISTRFCLVGAFTNCSGVLNADQVTKGSKIPHHIPAEFSFQKQKILSTLNCLYGLQSKLISYPFSTTINDYGDLRLCVPVLSWGKRVVW